MELKNRVPSHDTINRVLRLVSPEILQQLYGKLSLKILKMTEIMKLGLSMKKKRVAISLLPINYLKYFFLKDMN